MKRHLEIILAALALLTSTAFAQSTAFTYQGRVTDSGTNFTGPGQFKFALVTSTNLNHTATATANLSGASVGSYSLISGGNGYITPPAVTVSGGGGGGATAYAVLSGGAVSSVMANSAGSNYISAPTVTIAPPPANPSYTTYWSNDGTSTNGSQPSAPVGVTVNNGLFTVAIGDTTQPNMAAIAAALFTQPNLQLRIWFNDGVNGFAALDPAQNLTATPYAIAASSVPGGLTVQPSNDNSPDLIGGSPANFISSGTIGAVIAGGGSTNYSTFGNSTNVINSIIDGADFGTISGGFGNTVSGFGSTVCGGEDNTAGLVLTTVGGGWDNVASFTGAVVGGGQNNTANNYCAVVPGGAANTASGFYSFAAGCGAQALNNYSFAWSDGTSFSTTADYQFAVHAGGGILFDGNLQLNGGMQLNGGLTLAGNLQFDSNYRYLSMDGGNSTGFFYGSYPALGDGIHLGYNYYYDANGNGHIINTGGGTSRLSLGYSYAGIYVGATDTSPGTQRLVCTTTGVTVSGSFSMSSDRNVKQGFASISPAGMLDKVGQLPISEWSYKEDPTTRHVGPVAQDFYSIFNVGTDDKHISPIDEGGVALAAIQGLNQKLEANNTQLRQENSSLEKRLDALETEVKVLAQRDH